ncbi:hypothetical protein X737_33415 [Mesorhizobium sp. L48C026A00]|nr:hypothetical protein X737_33415 [Mesorhizobium sp. L48C026A00]
MPSDLAIKEVDGVLTRVMGLGERPQRVSKQAQQSRCVLAGIEMAPISARPGTREQACDQSAEHRDGGVGQSAIKFDELGCDRRAPSSGVEIACQPARGDIALTYLRATNGMNASPAVWIEAKIADETQPVDQGDQVLFARCFRQHAQANRVIPTVGSTVRKSSIAANRSADRPSRSAASMRRRAMARAARPRRSSVSAAGSRTRRSRNAEIIAYAIGRP